MVSRSFSFIFPKENLIALSYVIFLCVYIIVFFSITESLQAADCLKLNTDAAVTAENAICSQTDQSPQINIGG